MVSDRASGQAGIRFIANATEKIMQAQLRWLSREGVRPLRASHAPPTAPDSKPTRAYIPKSKAIKGHCQGSNSLSGDHNFGIARARANSTTPYISHTHSPARAPSTMLCLRELFGVIRVTEYTQEF